MKITYIANHGQANSNDDEGAIVYALTELGHLVTPVHESEGRVALSLKSDMILFHKWHDVHTLRTLARTSLCVFWYFDLVAYPGDSTLVRRNHQRMQWMNEVLPNVNLGFCTDGDWVSRVNGRHPLPDKPKLFWLPQGADERVTGPAHHKPLNDLLITATRRGGKGRESFIDEMTAKYGDRLTYISQGVHGRDLAKLIAQSKIVVAPDEPTTDNYWSNRVYLTLGFGGFLLHPWCFKLTGQYMDERDLVLYQSREGLHKKIEYYLGDEAQRKEIARNGYTTTTREHTYRHRCKQLINTVIKETA